MSDQIDKIIDNLKELKDKNLKKQEEITQMLKKFDEGKKAIDRLTKKLDENLEGIKSDLNNISDTKKSFLDNLKINPNNKDILGKEQVPYKLFYSRESILTDMFKIDSYRTLYNIFFSIMIFLSGNFLFKEYIQRGQIFDYELFLSLFEGFELSLLYSFYFYICSMVFLIFLQIFKTIFPVLNEFIGLAFYSIYFFSMTCYFLYLGKTIRLSFVCRFIYYVELVRNITKVFSYFVEKYLYLTYKIMHNKSESVNGRYITIKALNGEIEFHFKDKNNINTEILNFSYFYLAPTLIYRDQYPKIKERNYLLISVHLINFVFCIIFTFLVFKVLLIPYFDDETLSFIQSDRVVQTLVSFIIGSNFNMLILFFGIAHSLLNCTGEILCFGDRQFYEPFWIQTIPTSYYQSLIHNVQEFYDYVFKLFYQRYLGETITQIFHTLIFGVFLDFGLYYSLGFFSPILVCLIILSNFLSFIIRYLKHRCVLLLNFMVVSLGFGIFFLLELAGYYIVHKKEIYDNEGLTFWRKNMPKIIFFN
jgi:sterol O-acyltransferase